MLSCLAHNNRWRNTAARELRRWAASRRFQIRAWNGLDVIGNKV